MSRIAVACLVVAATLGASPARGHGITTYRGMCDASAAVALDAEHFAVADDEHNTLQIYRRQQAAPVGALDLAQFLGAKKEADLEGAATLDGITYWIASHGRNAAGELRPDRHRLFATERVPGSTPPALRPVGKPYRRLLDDLASAPSLAHHRLAEAATRAAEAEGGLNIEGLAATPQGQLLVGFRNPIPAGKALVVTIENPREVVLKNQRARVGAPRELDLGGRGIRSIEQVGAGYLIVAGPPADEGSFALYRWSGKANDAPTVLAVDFGSLRPEALFELPNTHAVQILSDDGGIDMGGVPCKKLPPGQRAFRSITVELTP